MNVAATAKAHVDQDQLEEARSLLQDALRENPNDTLLLTCYGAVLSDLGQHFYAEQTLVKAVDLGSQDRNTFFNLAVALMNLEGRRASAETWFKKAAAAVKDERSWEAYFDFHAH
jgi:Flp pilus assembly protein TadD